MMKGFLKFFVAFIGGFVLGAWCMCQIDKKNKDKLPIDSEFEDDEMSLLDSELIYDESQESDSVADYDDFE